MKPERNRWLNQFAGTVLTVLLAACAAQPKAPEAPLPEAPRPAPEPIDGPSDSGLRASDVRDAEPRAEPLARYGNHTPYQVFGKTYTVMASSKGFVERGTASWYGAKFHGRRTSSGEPYDMHLATAAHRHLPLPTFAEVTNLDNGRRVIVRINDRGPFKPNRVIDLSYAAALKLGIIATGTAPVEVRAIDPNEWRVAATVSTGAPAQAVSPVARPATSDGEESWLQAGAYGDRANAEALKQRLEQAELKPVSIHSGTDLFRVWLGPFRSAAEIEAVISRALELGFERPLRVKR